jgi:NADPH-dependent curcumin reductase CurA
MTEAKTVVLKVNLDEGEPGPEHFTIESKPAPSVPADGILIQALVFSADPYLVSATAFAPLFRDPLMFEVSIMYCTMA